MTERPPDSGDKRGLILTVEHAHPRLGCPLHRDEAAADEDVPVGLQGNGTESRTRGGIQRRTEIRLDDTGCAESRNARAALRGAADETEGSAGHNASARQGHQGIHGRASWPVEAEFPDDETGGFESG